MDYSGFGAYGQHFWSSLAASTGWKFTDGMNARKYYYDDSRFVRTIQYLADLSRKKGLMTPYEAISAPTSERPRCSKAKSVYLLIDKGMEYTLLLGKYFKERFVELGGTVVMEDNYQTGDKDFSAQITKLKGQKAKPEMLYIAAGPDDAATIVK